MDECPLLHAYNWDRENGQLEKQGTGNGTETGTWAGTGNLREAAGAAREPGTSRTEDSR